MDHNREIERPDDRRPRGSGDDPDSCGRCGASVDTTEWHPFDATVDDAGRVVVHAFCSMRCRDAWKATRQDEDES